MNFDAESAMKNVVLTQFIVVICLFMDSRLLGRGGCRNVKSRFSRPRPPCHMKSQESR